MRSQSYKILGSCDFLGNPLGLAHDVKEGFHGVMREGDLYSVVQGTTRGVANSASKVVLLILIPITRVYFSSSVPLPMLLVRLLPIHAMKRIVDEEEQEKTATSVTLSTDLPMALLVESPLSSVRHLTE